MTILNDVARYGGTACARCGFVGEAPAGGRYDARAA